MPYTLLNYKNIAHFLLRIIAILLAWSILLPKAEAQPISYPNLAVGAGLGTLGVSVNVQAHLEPMWGLVGEASYGMLNADKSYGQQTYSGDLQLLTVGAGAFVKPMGNGITTTAGLKANANKISISTTPQGATMQVGGNIYNANDISKLSYEKIYWPVAPYATVGYELGFGGNWSLNAHIGALYQGSGTVSYDVTPSSNGNYAAIQQNFEADAKVAGETIFEDTPDYPLWPIATLGLSFRF